MDLGFSWWTIALLAAITAPVGIAKLMQYWQRKAKLQTQSLATILQQQSGESR